MSAFGVRHRVEETVAAMSLTELADHIEAKHHVYLSDELPRLMTMTREVVAVHSGSDPRLQQVQDTFQAMAAELCCHMIKEEGCLFPLIRQLEASDRPPLTHRCSVAGPIRQMEFEHDEADSALVRLRELTDDFTPPEWSCSKYRVLLDALAHLEQDMHIHIHKENDVLFPRALELEAQRQRGVPIA